MEDLKILISSHNNKVARITRERELGKMFSHEWDKQMKKADEDLLALIIRVTDSIIGKDEDSNYSSAPGVGGFDIEKVARNNLRTEQRIKRDELVKK